MKYYFFVTAVTLLVFFSPQKIFAQSNYVLPYPSTMPGTIWYKVHLVIEEIEKYWYFGNFAQFEYNLKESDKYLVEAETLFEYKQYLLGYKALKKSDQYFIQAPKYIQKAEKEQKNTEGKQKELQAAAEKHKEVLKKTMNDLPESMTWRPEKEAPTKLPLRKAIQDSIQLRNNI
jgi:hypothetical protein